MDGDTEVFLLQDEQVDLHEVLILMFLGCSRVIALPAYIDKDNRRKQISLPCCLAIEGRLRSFTEANRLAHTYQIPRMLVDGDILLLHV